MTRPDRPHEDGLVEMMRCDPRFADDVLNAALQEAHEPGGREALLAALRCYAEARGMAALAQDAGLSRESLYRTLSPRGNPTLKTLLAITRALGLRLSAQRVRHA